MSKVVRLYKTKTKELICIFIAVLVLIPAEGIAILSPVIYQIIWGSSARIFAGGILLLLFIMKLPTVKLDRTVIISVNLFFILMLCITFIRGGSIRVFFSNYYNAWAIFLLVVICENRFSELIDVSLFYLEILIVVNLASILLYPNGMYISETTHYTKNWILGYKSSLQYYVVPAIIFSWISSEYKGTSKRKKLFIILCLTEAALSENVMLLLCCMIMAIVDFYKLNKKTLVFNTNNYALVIIMVNVLVLFFFRNITYNNFFSKTLLLLQKSNDLGGRINKIWPVAFKKISESFLLGYGCRTAEWNRNLYGIQAAIHAHNQWLELFMNGGVVLFIAYCFLVYILLRGWSKKHIISAQILLFGLFICFLMGTIEIFMRHIGAAVWMVFYFMPYADRIDQQYKRYCLK
jgi:O-antigen ligase